MDESGLYTDYITMRTRFMTFAERDKDKDEETKTKKKEFLKGVKGIRNVEDGQP